jgi:hypothetical protein
MTPLHGVSPQTWNDEPPGAVYLRPKLSTSILRDTAPLSLVLVLEKVRKLPNADQHRASFDFETIP